MGVFTDTIKERIFLNVFNKYKCSSMLMKVIYWVVILLILFLFSRLNYLGSGLERISKNTVPIYIPYVDTKPEKLKIRSIFKYVEGSKSAPLVNGGQYRSGTHFSINFAINVESWILIVSMDNKGIFPIFTTGFIPVNYKPFKDKSLTVIDLKLDENTGDESYYIFASKNKYSFEKDIKPFLTENIESSKGAKVINLIKLPEGIISKGISFSHI